MLTPGIKASEMIENIVNEFRIMLFENDWMDYMSKKSALDKVKNIFIKIIWRRFIEKIVFY